MTISGSVCLVSKTSYCLLPRTMLFLTMSYAIIGINKLKSMSSVRSSQAHAYRTIHTANADPARQHKNQTVIGTAGDICGDVKRRISQLGYKPRVNAVPCVELMLTTSPEFWTDKTDQDLQRWIDSSIDWAKARYGDENVVHTVLHRDETTPHLSMFVTPIILGRLTARDVVGNQKKMQETHSSYATAMSGFGLERGILGSGATRQNIDKYVNAVAEVSEHDMIALAEVTDLPVGKSTLEGWKVSEMSKRKKLVERCARDALASVLAVNQVAELKNSNSDYKQANDLLLSELSDLRDKLTLAYEELGLSKEMIGALRKHDISAVAQHLNYTGFIKPRENPIDLVMRVNEFDFGQAVAWLYHAIGPLQTGAIVNLSAPPDRPFTPSENVIKQAIKEQLDALGCNEFRLSIVPEGEGKPFLPGKKGDEEQFYSREEIIKLIPWLRYENNQKKHIFITPIDTNAYYILLDDARTSLDALEKHGFQPCVVQSTSWDKQQIIFKVPKSLDRDAVLAVFNQMNQALGDPSITGLRHPFRLAGFRNMKAKHKRNEQQPFVTLSLAVNRFCERCSMLVRQVMSQVPQKSLPASSPHLR